MDSDDDLHDVEVVVESGMGSAHTAAPLVAPASTRNDGPLMIQAAPGAAGAVAVPLDDAAMTKEQKAAAFMKFLMDNDRRVYSVAFVGFTQHGKTTLVRALFGASAVENKEDAVRAFTTRVSVQTAVVDGARHKTSHHVTAIDTPGQPSFRGEVDAGLALASTAVVCVDCVEGMHPSTERTLRTAVAEGCTILLMLTKLERIVTELKLPIRSACDLLESHVNTVSNTIVACGGEALVPARGDVCFCSERLSIAFTVPSMACKYAATNSAIDADSLATRLWGATTYDTATRQFMPLRRPDQLPAFAAFVLEPLYKVLSHTFAGEATFTTKTHHDTMAAAVRNAATTTFGPFKANVIDAIFDVAPNARNERCGRALRTWQLREEASAREATTVARAALVVDVANARNVDDFYAVCKVQAGTLATGQRVALVNRPDSAHRAIIGQIAVPTAAGLVVVPSAAKGTVVFVRGLASLVEDIDAALVLNEGAALPEVALAPVSAAAAPSVRVAVEPKKPDDAAAMKEALKCVAALHPGCRITIEDTGDHVVHAPSELYLDVVMRELRGRYCRDAPLRLSDPFVSFTETVSAPKGVLRVAAADGTALGFVATPVGHALGRALDAGTVTGSMPRDELCSVLQSQFDWDALATSGLVGFGPDTQYGPNAVVADLVDGAIPAEALQAILQGCSSALRRGPVCGEPVREVRIAIVEAQLPDRLHRRALAGVTALTRHLTKTALMSAAPRLMEPVADVDVLTVPANAETIAEIVARRRGAIRSEYRVPATPLVRLRAQVPMMDTFGLEAEVRLKSDSNVLVTCEYSHWAVVPGDPLDDGSAVVPLHAAAGGQLAYDFMSKTRRRRGLPDAVELL